MTKLLAIAVMALFVPLLAAAPSAAADPSPQSSPTPTSVVGITEVALLNYSGRISQVAYSPNGRYLAVAIIDGPLVLLNATTLVEEANFPLPAPNWVSVSSLSWSPNSDKIGAGYQGGAVAVWYMPGGANAWSKGGILYDIRGVSWSPDGRYLAAGFVHSINIYWGQDGTLNATLSSDYGGSQPAGLSWSPDSDYIAIGQQAYSPTGAIVAIFEANLWTKALTHRWTGPGMDSVAFEGRGRFLGVSLGMSRMEVWEVRNWTQYANISTAAGLEQFAWTADGSRLVLLETEPSAMPNETQDFGGFEVLHLGGGANNSSALGVSPDGRRIAVGYQDGTLRVLAVGEDRLFDDRTPLRATTGDPLLFDVRSTATGQVDVVYTDTSGGRLTRASLTASGDRHTVTVTVPSNWSTNLLYHFDQASRAIVTPWRLVRVSDNDPPVLDNWTFARQGARGELAVANATMSDNLRLLTGSFQIAIDGSVASSATAGGAATLSFALTAPLFPQNRSLRLEAYGVDDAGNGGPLFSVTIPLDDLARPEFGADVSEAGTAGGRIKLGVEATDDRDPPSVTVTYRELTATLDLPWATFTLNAPPPGSSAFYATFPLGRDSVAVEYAFRAVDAAGNENSTEVRVQRVFDRDPPEIVVDLSDRRATLGDPLHLGVVVRDNIGIDSVAAFVQQDGGATTVLNMTAWAGVGEGGYEANFTVGASAGNVTYSFFVADVEGNSIASGAKRLRVEDNDAPVVTVLNTGLKIVSGQAFTLQVRVMDASPVAGITIFYRRVGESAFFTDDFLAPAPGRDLNLSVPFASLNISTHRDARSIQLYLYARDAAGNPGYLGSKDDPLVVEVVDAAPPRAAFQIVGSLIVGSVISFDGSISTDDLGIVAYNWTVDGTEAGSAPNLERRFGVAGDHEVRLTVTDAAGKTHSTTQTLTISPAPAAPIGVGGSAELIAVVAVAVGAVIAGALLLMRRRKPPTDETPPTT